MKLSNKEKIDIINYLQVINGKYPLSRNYKIQIKNIGCNAKCPICDDWRNNSNKEKIKENLNEVFKEILSEKVKYKQVQILGGEPLLFFSEILKIIKLGTENGIKFNFPTNASLLNIEKINKLINAGLNIFTFSIDFTNKYHDEWRNLPGAFEKIINFTNYIKEKGIVVQWNTVIGKFNISEITEFNKLYKTCFPNIHNFIEIEDNGGDSKIYFLNINEKSDILNKLNILKKDNKNIDIIINGFQNCKIKNLESNKCFIPIKLKSYIIDENGFKVFPCYQEFQKVPDIINFSKNAIINGCNLCKSSYKNNYNSYMLNLIKKYKLSNK